jgi:integrase
VYIRPANQGGILGCYRRSKTDQEGHGVTIAIARGVTTCPVKAVKAWLQAAGITEGPLFRPVAKGGRLGAERLTDQSVCNIVKAYAEQIGLKSTDFGAHSLRAGFLTSAARRGASVFKMRDVSRHKSMDVLQALCPRRRSVPGSRRGGSAVKAKAAGVYKGRSVR